MWLVGCQATKLIDQFEPAPELLPLTVGVFDRAADRACAGLELDGDPGIRGDSHARDGAGHPPDGQWTPPSSFLPQRTYLSIDEAGRSHTERARLLEREAELAQLDRLLKQAAGGEGTLVFIEGIAGAGKTSLVQVAAHLGRARGMLVLEAAGSELERDLGFGVVRGLFEKTLSKAGAAARRTLLSGAASMAAPVVWRTKSVAATDPAAALHGLFWLVSNLAERGAVMLAVDDAHWADAPSLRFLAYLSRRLSGLPVLLLVAMRPHEPGGQGELLTGLKGEPGCEVLSPSVLSEEAVGLLVAERMAGPPAREFIAACHAATGGNPFLVGELITALVNDGVAPTADGAGRVSQIGPQTVSRMVLARVSRVGREAVALTEAVAVLGGGELRDCAALARLDPEAAAQASDALVHIGVLHPTRPLRFVHPLVHAALYEAIPPGRRSLIHTAGARLLILDGASPDRVALHLLHAEPAGENWVVEALRRAAAAASFRGAPEQAASYLRRAMREPPAADERGAVLHELGAAELLTRDPGASNHLAQALDATDDPGSRGQIALLLGRAAVSGGRLNAARELLEPLIDRLRSSQPDVVARLEAYRAASLVWGPDFSDQVVRELPRLRAVAEDAGPAGRSLLLLIAFRYAQEGRDPAEMLRLVERGLDEGRLIESESAEAIEITWAARVLLFTDQLAHAERLVDAMVADSHKRGSVTGYATACAWRADLELRRGRVSAAEAQARAAIDLAAAHGLFFLSPYAHSFLGEALIELGRLEEASELLERADLGPMLGSGPEGRLLHTRARVQLARGKGEAAVALMRSWDTLKRPVPWELNPNAMAWRSTLALALPTSARGEALDLVDRELKEARRVGLPRAIGVALRARALLCKSEEQIALLTDAVAAFESCPSPLEQARALTDWGAALRRASRRTEAREVLAHGLDLAAGCGARALASRAREELLAAGARPRRERLSGVDSLTASEMRVAQMAAEGMTNREIAQALFVTIKAVALHLTRVYEKLHIDGRPELRGSLDAKGMDSTFEASLHQK